LATQTIIITGSTQGLGFGYAREFLRRGHNVIVSGRDPSRVQSSIARLAAEFPGSEARIAGTACDVSRLSSVQALWDFGAVRFGHIDIWLNNAGFARTGAQFADNTADEIETMVRSNVIGSINAAQVAVAGFKRQASGNCGGGKLYLTLGGGGASGRVVPGMTVYSTTKRAVKYLTDCLVRERNEERDESMLIGTISPGINITEGLIREMRALPAERRAKALRQLSFIGEHVETTTSWIVERVLADKKQGNDITWLTTGRMVGRVFSMLFGSRRNFLSRYSFES